MNAGYINVKDYGAVGNGSTNDIAAIRNAITEAAHTPNSILLFPSATGYLISETLSIPIGISVIMDAPLIFNGAANVTALVIGTTNTVNDNRTFVLNVTRQPLSNWSSESQIGIKLVNSNSCDITITQANGFTIGVQCIGDAKGFAYNQVSLGYLMNNKYALDLTNIRQGWCNENLFLNGRFGTYSDTNRGLSRYGVRITSQDLSYRNNNNNVFIKPSFELLATLAQPGEALPILIEHGLQNAFYSCRHENSGPFFAKIVNESSENIFDIGYSSDVDMRINDTSAYPTSVLTIRRAALQQQSLREIFNSGPLFKSACYYDGNTRVNVPHVHIGDAFNATANAALSNIAITSKYLEVAPNRGLGVFVDTSENKQFIVSRNVISGYGGRVAIRCYDTQGNVLTGSANLVKGYPYMSPYYSNDFGGTYVTGSDSEDDFYFQVANNVSYIVVLLRGGTKSLRIKGFSLSTVLGGKHCTVWAGYEEIIPGANIGINPPIAGTWERGRRIFNALPATRKPDSWVCITSGTPGVWKSVGSIS